MLFLESRFCPFYKTVWMLRNFVTYYNLAQQALEQSTLDNKITWSVIRQHTADVRAKLSAMKFEVH
jgi:V-type H+-transporting ATPase subunit A